MLWEQVEQTVSESTDLSFSFVAFMVLATLLASVGNPHRLGDPDRRRDGRRPGVRPACGTLRGDRPSSRVRSRGAPRLRCVVGFPVAIVAAYLLTAMVRAFDLGPDAADLEDRADTFFISHPDAFSVIVALLAGTAGMLSLSTGRAGALIGVLISVTTIPAAANIGVAAAYRNWDECQGAALQLVLNLSAIVLAGVVTLGAERTAFRRRRARG